MGKEEKSRRRIVGQLAAQPAVGRECENIEACLSCDSRAIDRYGEKLVWEKETTYAYVLYYIPGTYGQNCWNPCLCDSRRTRDDGNESIENNSHRLIEARATI